MTTIEFGREICGDPSAILGREWLVTNGIGGYASGSIGNVLTRRYHGLLVAALKPPIERMVLLTKLDEAASYDQQTYQLFSNQWQNSQVPLQPTGFYHLEKFHLEGTTPVWTYAFADALLEKRVWMQYGKNTTYICYTLRRGSQAAHLSIKALANYTDFHTNIRTPNWQMSVENVPRGLKISANAEAVPLYLLSAAATLSPKHEWYRDYFLAAENERGLDALADHLHVGMIEATLQTGDSITLVASTEDQPSLSGEEAWGEHAERQAALLEKSQLKDAPIWINQLVLAADQFIVHRQSDDQPDGGSIIAGYHWFGDWGRDTMISLPGLTMVTGRLEEAAAILRTYARFIDQGMLPNRFPDRGEEPEYNTVDATLWYFIAIQSYLDASHDTKLLKDLYPALQDIIVWHQRGTRYNIHVDPQDGLLYAGEDGVQLTWMDVKVYEWVVTPRIGKPVEINALWYNALRLMAAWAKTLGEPESDYRGQADRVEENFMRFWNDSAGYCYDVIDSPHGDDIALRPNQLFAVSLPHSPLTTEQGRTIVDICGRHLLTSFGLRSLAPEESAYQGHYNGGVLERDTAYHQGTVWAWLIGAFVAAHWRVYQDKALARSFLEPFADHLHDAGLGSLSEIFEGNPPFRACGAIAQAWSVAEVLRVWQLTQT